MKTIIHYLPMSALAAYFWTRIGIQIYDNPKYLPLAIAAFPFSLLVVIAVNRLIRRKEKAELTKDAIRKQLQTMRSLKQTRLTAWEERAKEGCTEEDCGACPFFGDPCDEIDQERLKAQTWYDKHKGSEFKRVEVDFDYLWDIGVKF